MTTADDETKNDSKTESKNDSITTPNSQKKSSLQPATEATTNTRSLGWALMITSLAMGLLVIFFGFNQRYWLLPPEQKLISSWREDLQLLKKSKQAELLSRVSQVRLRANDHSPAADWVEKIQAPIEKNKSGDILADIFLIHQIEGHRYGVIVQYEFIDTKTKNKVGEFARTLWLGIYY